MEQPLSLAKWFDRQVANQGAASRSTLMFFISLKLIRLSLLVGAYWWFAQVFQAWVVEGEAAPFNTIVVLTILLFSAWCVQGIIDNGVSRAKMRLQQALQQRLIATFEHQQHALIRQQSSFYWQSVWLKHIPALADWRYDYQAQQMVAGVAPFLTLLVIFPVNSVIGASLLFTMPVVPLFMIIVGKGAASLQRKHFNALTRLGGMFVDRLAALPMLASFRAHDREQTRLHNASLNLNERTMKVVSVAFLSSSVLDFFSTIAVALIAVFIGFSLLGEFSLGPELALNTGVWLLLTAPLLFSELKALGQYYHQKAQAEVAREDLDTLFNLESACLKQVENTVLLNSPITGFSVGDSLVTAESLHINSGDCIRLNGHSGSGKTLVLEALAGQRPSSHRFHPHRERIGFYTQSPVVLPGSVRDNLAMGQLLDDAMLVSALCSVELAAWLDALPQGLDTEMGEHPPLSGGQAQRLALARLLLSGADIWLLDEPTAHLTEEQHHALSALIKQLGAQKTLLWASHKPLPEAWFSQIWLVEKGVVTSQ